MDGEAPAVLGVDGGRPDASRDAKHVRSLRPLTYHYGRRPPSTKNAAGILPSTTPPRWRSPHASSKTGKIFAQYEKNRLYNFLLAKSINMYIAKKCTLTTVPFHVLKRTNTSSTMPCLAPRRALPIALCLRLEEGNATDAGWRP